MEADRTQYLHRIHAQIALMFVLLLTVGLLTGCDSNSTTENSPSSPSKADLNCPECEIVDVEGVVDANTLKTSIGDIKMYGAYVVEHPRQCSEQAEDRLRQLSGSQVRIKPGPTDSVRKNPNHYYLFAMDGESIEQKLVSEGLALAWTQDGEHVGWFIFLDAVARRDEAGCLWHDYQAFQRGEPSEFKIPGLPER